MKRQLLKATGMEKLLLPGLLVFMFALLLGSDNSTIIGQAQAQDLDKILEEHQVDPKEQSHTTSAEAPKPAPTGIEGVVDCGATLRVRAWPWGRIIGGFRNGDKVTVLGMDGDFYRIDFGGKTGYVHRNYVSLPGKPAGKYGVTYPPGCAEGGNGYLPKPGASAGTAPSSKPTTQPGVGSRPPANKPSADKPSDNHGSKPSSIDLDDAKTIGKRMGDGTRVGAVAWGMDQMKGGTQRGVNSNNGQRSSNIKAWNGYCLAFVGTCWGRKVPDLRASSAYNAYKQCKASGRTFHKSGVPTPGAAMFFGPTSGNPYGHAIIATGEVDRSGDPIILSTTGHGGLYGIQKMPLRRMLGMMGRAPFYGWTSMP